MEEKNFNSEHQENDNGNELSETFEEKTMTEQPTQEAVEIENSFADTEGTVLDGFDTEGADGWTPATGLSAVRLRAQAEGSVLQTVPAVPEGQGALSPCSLIPRGKGEALDDLIQGHL